MQIAFGSASEVEYQLLLAHDLAFLGNESYERTNSQVVEIKRMLTSLLRTIQGSTSKTTAAARR